MREKKRSGLICLNWYDWNTDFLMQLRSPFDSSGLICLNWYDWNRAIGVDDLTIKSCRDWSAWIDTIETLRCGEKLQKPLSRSGLICLNWYDWNLRKASVCVLYAGVGIDLPELIRLKPDFSVPRISSRYNVGIDLPELIRLKLMVHHIIRFQLKLGRDWSAWIDTIETDV